MSRGIRIGARAAVVGAALALALQFLQPSIGFAQATIALSTYSGPPGTAVTVTGSGFANGDHVTVYFDGTPITSLVASPPNGSFSVTISVPNSASYGLHTISVGAIPSGLTASQQFQVTSGAGTSLSVFKSVEVNGGGYYTSTTAPVGSTLTYAIQYRNIGSAYATNAYVTDTLQPGQNFVSASAGCTTASSGGLTTVTCAVGTLPPANTAGSYGTVFISTQVTGTAGTINNTAQLYASNVPSQNSNTTQVTIGGVGGGTGTGLTKTVSVNGSAYGTSVTAVDGNTLNYSIQYTNLTGATVTGVVIYDTLQPGQTLLSFPATSGLCTVYNASTNTLACSIGSLANGQSVSINIATAVNNSFSGLIGNQAWATANNATTIYSNTTTVQVGVVTPPPPFTGNLTLCGIVAYGGGNTITISGVTVQLAPGAFISGTPINGANECITFNYNGSSFVSSVSITQNLAGVGLICGVYSSTGTSATINVGGIIIPVVNSTVFQPFLTTGSYYCFLLTSNGAAYSVLSGIPTSAAVIKPSGGLHANGAFGF